MESKDAITGVGVPRSKTGPATRTGRSPSDPLGVLLGHAREHPHIDAAILLTVDVERTRVESAAQWFATPELEVAAEPLVRRAYDPDLPGVVEATLERGRSLFLPRLEDWEAAVAIWGRVESTRGPMASELVQSAFAHASTIACPVRAPLGRALGVLLAASVDSARPLLRVDLRGSRRSQTSPPSRSSATRYSPPRPSAGATSSCWGGRSRPRPPRSRRPKCSAASWSTRWSW